MNGKRRERPSAAPGVILLALLFYAQAAVAADPPRPAGNTAPAEWNWTGFYIGGHAGAFRGTTSFSDSRGPDIFGGDVTAPGFMLGMQLGYDWLVAPQWVVGLQADASYLFSEGSNTCLQSSTTITGSTCSVTPDAFATMTGRLGYVTEPRGRTMVYGKGGLAWMLTSLSMGTNNAFSNGAPDPNLTLDGKPFQGGPAQSSTSALGWTLGAGVEHALTSAWSLNMEYDYLRFSGIGATTPATANVTLNGNVTTIPAGMASVAQDIHVVKVGLNYRWGVRSGADRSAGDGAATPAAPAQTPWTAGWEVEGGTRYWYSWGKFQSANGPETGAISRLTFDNMVGQSGEIFARVDSPNNIFMKGLIGGGFVTGGKMNDEDWALPGGYTGNVPIAYEVTDSPSAKGSFTYLTADIGYNVMRAPDHKVGFFIGYNRYHYDISMFGCQQLTTPASGICAPPSLPTAPDTNGITEVDTWHSVRLGASAEVELWDRVKIAGDFAYLPYVYLDALDIHRSRQPPLYFPAQGNGNGVQAEIMLTYRATESLSFGIGARYWSMWTNSASQGSPADFISISTERYGLLVQAAYKFN